MHKTLIFLAFVFISLSSIAQFDTLYHEGKYFNVNVYVFNPDVNGEYSIQEIIVNEDTVRDDLATNGIEIDFTPLELKEEAEIDIKIIYVRGYLPTIVNPEALNGQQVFRFSRPKMVKGKLQWRVSGDLSDYPIVIEEYKWNEWRVVGEVDPLDTVKNRLYQYELKVHSGTNRIRLYTTNVQGQKIVSKELRYHTRLIAVNLESTRVKEEIVFSAETDYEIYDSEGKMIKSGTERYVDVKDLIKGEYWLNFDNQTIKIKKK